MPRPKKQVLPQDVTQAAVNSPILATIKFTLGSNEYPVLDLPYDDYVLFLTLLQPLLQAATGQLAKAAGLSAAADAASPTSLITHCAENLPELAHIVVRQSVPLITIGELKAQAKTPFKLADIVLKQIQQNNMISDIADFFVQILPYLSAGKNLAKKATVEATPSS